MRNPQTSKLLNNNKKQTKPRRHTPIMSFDPESECIICRDTSSTLLDPLVSPCSCTSHKVHMGCWYKWNLSRPVRKGMTKCEVCNTHYWNRPLNCYAMMAVACTASVLSGRFSCETCAKEPVTQLTSCS